MTRQWAQCCVVSFQTDAKSYLFSETSGPVLNQSNFHSVSAGSYPRVNRPRREAPRLPEAYTAGLGMSGHVRLIPLYLAHWATSRLLTTC